MWRLFLLVPFLTACADPEPPRCVEDGETACFRGVFRKLLGGTVEGVRVCAPQQKDIACVTSDVDGGWKMPGLPLDEDVYLTARHEDGVPALFPQNTTHYDYGWYKVVVPPSIMDLHANRLDVSLNPDRGHVLFLVWEGLNWDGVDTPNVSDVSVRVLDGPADVFYSDALGLASDRLEVTSGSGAGGLLNVKPGTVRLRFKGPQGACKRHMFHYAMDETGAFDVPIRAGFTTAIDVRCAP